MTFKAGDPAGPGRPKGSVGGRTRALLILDEVLNEDDVQISLKNKLRDYFNADPVRFFQTIVMPLVPKEAKLQLHRELEAGITWGSLIETFPLESLPPVTPSESLPSSASR